MPSYTDGLSILVGHSLLKPDTSLVPTDVVAAERGMGRSRQGQESRREAHRKVLQHLPTCEQVCSVSERR